MQGILYLKVPKLPIAYRSKKIYQFEGLASGLSEETLTKLDYFPLYTPSNEEEDNNDDNNKNNQTTSDSSINTNVNIITSHA